MKLFLEGVVLFDEDLLDETLLKGQTVIMAFLPPPPPLTTSRAVTPTPPLLLKQNSKDFTVQASTSTHSTPEPVKFVETPQKDLTVLPTFSTTVDMELRRSGQKNCSAETWKKVCILFFCNTLRKKVLLKYYYN